MNVLSIDVESTSEAAGMARSAVASAIGADVSRSLLNDAQLLTSEVVTNAVRHAGMTRGNPIGLAIDLSSEMVRVEVSDGGPGFDLTSPTVPVEGKAEGWGLHLVGRVSDRWGAILDHRHVVWFELHREADDYPLSF